MSFKPVPAQQEAVAYVTRAAAAFDGELLLGGHSKGGHLALYAAAHAAPEVQARISRVYSFDGPGVDEEHREHIFEPFFTTHHQGTGLGLYIARELCEANGAQLELRHSDEGAHFCISGRKECQ